MKRKYLTETPVCPRERLVIISYTTGLSFALERIGPLAAIIITVFYLIVLYLFALPNTPENLFASIYSESLIKTVYQHLLLLVGFDTLIYRKYYDTPPILVGHQSPLCRRPRSTQRHHHQLHRGLPPSGLASLATHHCPLPPPTASTATPITIWSLEISPHTKSKVLKLEHCWG
jgi:hypothetical protein